MKTTRKIIKIDEQLCNGCGECITSCAEGALAIINGKAKLVKESYCDGLGACTGECPTGALTIEEREADDFNEGEVKRNLVNATGATQAIRSELAQWPVQLHLINPKSPFLKDKELVLISTCSPVASADLHWRFIRDRAVIMACPKLDNTTGYLEKLVQIIDLWHPPTVIVIRMEVPCCSGLTRLASQAINESRTSITKLQEVIVGINGDILSAV